MTGSKFHTVMVVGDNPEELMKKYDISLKVAPYIKFKYLDADKMRKNACKVMQELIKNRDKFGFNDLQADYFKEKLKSLNSMSSFEYYSSLTEGMYYDENGNALSEENPNGKWTTYALGRNFSYPLKLKNGEESYQAMMAQMLAMTNSLRNTPEEEKKEKLRSRLIEMISEELKQRGSCNLCTDYHPEGDLYRISKELDISESSFPWKTNMNITEYEVEVKCGYGASYETLYFNY